MLIQFLFFIFFKSPAVTLWRCIFYTKYSKIKQISQNLRELILFVEKMNGSHLGFPPCWPFDPIFKKKKFLISLRYTGIDAYRTYIQTRFSALYSRYYLTMPFFAKMVGCLALRNNNWYSLTKKNLSIFCLFSELLMAPHAHIFNRYKYGNSYS